MILIILSLLTFLVIWIWSLFLIDDHITKEIEEEEKRGYKEGRPVL